MSQAEDLSAINDFMLRTAPVTPEATALRDSWKVWYPSLSWYQLHHDDDIRDEASTRRNKFNLANAKTQAEKARVIEVITKGLDNNQMQGKARKETLPTGEVGSQIKKPTAPLTGTHPTIKQGSTGPAVVEWQKFLGTAADGKFGPNTTALTKAFQKKSGLNADGVVGNATWTAALGTAPVEVIASKEPGFFESLLGTTPDARADEKADVRQSVASAIKAHPKVSAKPNGATTGATPVQSTSTAKTSTPSGGSSAASTSSIAPVMQAGMFGSIGKLPMWAKISAVVATVGVIIFGRNAKVVNYNTHKTSKRRRAA